MRGLRRFENMKVVLASLAVDYSPDSPFVLFDAARESRPLTAELTLASKRAESLRNRQKQGHAWMVLDHGEVARRENRRAGQCGELHRGGGARAVGLKKQGACRIVVNDPVVRISCGDADDEGAGRER